VTLRLRIQWLGMVAGSSAVVWEASGTVAAAGAALARAAEPTSLRARYGQPASPPGGPRQLAMPGPRPLPLPDQGWPAPAGAAGAGQQPPASLDGKAPLGCCARAPLPLRPGACCACGALYCGWGRENCGPAVRPWMVRSSEGRSCWCTDAP